LNNMSKNIEPIPLFLERTFFQINKTTPLLVIFILVHFEKYKKQIINL